MNKEQFWSIVDDVRNSTDPRNQKQVCAALEKRLRVLPSEEIVEWHQIFEFYQNTAYRNDLWAASAAMGAHCTDDGFIDFRSWLISQGRDVYLAAMQAPDSLAEVDTTGQDLNFETYPYAAIRAYAQRKVYEEKSLSQFVGQYTEWAAQNELRIREEVKRSPLLNVDINSVLADRFLNSHLLQKYDLYAAEEAHELSAHVRNNLSADIPDHPDISPDWRKRDITGIMPQLCAKFEAKQQCFAEQVKTFGEADCQWRLQDVRLQHFLGTLPCASQEELQVFTHRIAALTADGETILTAMIGQHDPRTAECMLELLEELPDYAVLHGIGTYEELGRYFLAMETDMQEELYPYMDLEALGRRYEDEHPGVFIGNDYVQYPPVPTQTMGMEMI